MDAPGSSGHWGSDQTSVRAQEAVSLAWLPQHLKGGLLPRGLLDIEWSAGKASASWLANSKVRAVDCGG